MWAAYDDGKLDDLIATMHPDVRWTPITRPGRTVYSGHAGMRDMHANIEGVRGKIRVALDQVVLLADGSVLTGGRGVFPAGSDPPSLAFEARCTFLDGLIVSVDSYEPGEPS